MIVIKIDESDQTVLLIGVFERLKTFIHQGSSSLDAAMQVTDEALDDARRAELGDLLVLGLANSAAAEAVSAR